MADLRIPEDKASEVFELAARLYARHRQNHPLQALNPVHSPVDIPPEFIQKALGQLQAREEEARELAQRARLHRRWVSVGALVAGAALAVWAGLTYSRLQRAARSVDLAWFQVESQFQQQADVVTKLLNQPIEPHPANQALRQQLSQARQRYNTATTQAERLAAAEAVDQAVVELGSALIELPAAQSDNEIGQLTKQLNNTETRIASEGQRYNLAAGSYNLAVNSFPTLLLAGPLGFESRPLFTPSSN